MVDAEKEPSRSEFLFLHLISMFQVAAMQQMGKLIDPVTQKVSRDLEQARVSIDILDGIKEKTRGNLSKLEQDYLEKVLFELHMNFVEESKRSDGAAEGGAEPGGGEASPEGEEEGGGHG